MSETKAAFGERTIWSLKNILYRYMEDNGYKYLHKLTPLVTILFSQGNCPTDLTPKNVDNSGYLSILFSKLIPEFRKPKFKIEDKLASLKMTYRSEKGVNQSVHRKFSKLLHFSSKKPPTYAIKHEQNEIILGKFYQKELIKFIHQWNQLQ